MSRRIAPVDSGFSEPDERRVSHSATHYTTNSAQRQSWAAPVEDADGTYALRRTMSASTIESGNPSDYTAGYHAGYNPIFQSQWDAEFRQNSYSPWPIRIFAAIGAVYNVYMAGKFASAFGALAVFATRVLGSIFLLLHCENRSYQESCRAH